MLSFGNLFNPFRDKNDKNTIKEAILLRYSEVEKEYNQLLNDTNLTIDELLEKCLSIAQNHVNIPTHLSRTFPKIRDNQWLCKVLFSDVLTSSLIYFRSFLKVDEINLGTFVNMCDKSLESDEYNNYARYLRDNVPNYLKDLFGIRKPKTEYKISTQYQTLLFALIKKSGEAPYSAFSADGKLKERKINTFRSFPLNNRNFIETWDCINDLHDKNKIKDDEIYNEEFYIYERLFDLGIRLHSSDLFLNTLKMDTTQIASLLLVIYSMMLLPNVVGKFTMLEYLYDIIFSKTYRYENDFINLINFLDIICNYYFPLCYTMFCGYLMENNQASDFEALRNRITKSKYFNHIKIGVSPKHQLYAGLNKVQVKKYHVLSLFWEAKYHFMNSNDPIIFFNYSNEFWVDAIGDCFDTIKYLVKEE